nr:putative urease accessory protein uref-like [Quercus suber]
MSTTPAPESKSAITFTEKEEHVLRVAWACLKSGPPEVDIVKLTTAGGFKTNKTAANTWGTIKKKLAQMNPPHITSSGEPGESATPHLNTPKTKGSPKKRGKNTSSDNGERETDFDNGESPKKKQRKSPAKKTPNKVGNNAVADDRTAEEEAIGGAAVLRTFSLGYVHVFPAHKFACVLLHRWGDGIQLDINCWVYRRAWPLCIQQHQPFIISLPDVVTSLPESPVNPADPGQFYTVTHNLLMTTTPSLHALLLLSDSALPLGSFAFSSGLESFLAHTKVSNSRSAGTNQTQTSLPPGAFDTFLSHSIQNLASTTLPYVLASYHDPKILRALDNDFDASTPCTVARRASSLHALLLLSDSALPLGSFAFSSGLESFLAHTKVSNSRSAGTNQTQTSLPPGAFDTFLSHSIQNLASTTLPYVLASYHDPKILRALDNDFDASTPCTVARRASVTQGRALLTIWERALKAATADSGTDSGQDRAIVDAARHELTRCATDIKTATPDVFGVMDVNGHLAPLFGAVCCALGLQVSDAAYLFLLNHAKAVLSAAVRASVMGPYQAQAMLASEKLQGMSYCIRESSTHDAAYGGIYEER